MLLVVEIGASQTGNLVVLRDVCKFGRLGQDVDQTKHLAPEAIDRCLDIVNNYRAIIDELGVDAIRAVGTQALREATNANLFVKPAQTALGTSIEIIAGRREAELVQLAVTKSFPTLCNQSVVIADVGGGSTEIVISNHREIQSLQSLPIGSVRLAERCLKDDPPSPEQIADLHQEISNALSKVAVPKNAQLIGTAGTATTIAAVQLQLDSYQPDKIHGHRITRAILENQLNTYLTLPIAKRRQIRGLEPQRADVIAAGVGIYAHLLKKASGDMVVSDRGVRWGLAYELADQIAIPCSSPSVTS